MNGFESLFSIPVIAAGLWWYVQRQLKKALEKLENSVDKKDFKEFKEEFHKAKDDLWKERDDLINRTAHLEGGNTLARDIAEELRKSR